MTFRSKLIHELGEFFSGCDCGVLSTVNRILAFLDFGAETFDFDFPLIFVFFNHPQAIADDFASVLVSAGGDEFFDEIVLMFGEIYVLRGHGDTSFEPLFTGSITGLAIIVNQNMP